MKRDIIEKLEFGCPFKPGTIGEKDAELAEVLMQEAAEEIRRLREEIEFFVKREKLLMRKAFYAGRETNINYIGWLQTNTSDNCKEK